MNKNLLLLVSAGCFLLAPVQSHLFGFENPQKDQTFNASQDKVISDQALTKAVKDAIAGDRNLSPFAATVRITAVNGTVTLAGNVDTAKEKSDIEAKAKSVSGVDKVVNNIEVKSTMPSGQK